MSDAPAPAHFDYIVSGLDSSSRRVTERIAATSAAEAVQVLRDKGLTDIKLHTDDVNRFVRVNGTTPEDELRYLSPEERAAVGTREPLQKFLHLSGKFYRGRGFRAPLALVALVLVWHIVHTRTFDWLDGILVLVLLSPMVFVLWVTRHSAVQRRVQRAQLRADWKTVIRLLPRLDRAFRALGESGRVVSITTCHAKALATAGRRTDAFALIDALAKRPDIPADTVWCRRAAIHGNFAEWQAVVDCYRQAAELNPASFLPHVGMAAALAIHLRQPREAAQALARALSFPMTDETKTTLDVTKGAIALEERRYQDAIVHFESYLAFARSRARRTPIVRGLAATEALAAIAYANTGDLSKARRYLKSTEPLLTPHRSLQDLLQRARQSVGSPLAQAAPS